MKILLAVDGSQFSLRATRYVARLQKQLAEPADIVLLNVDPPLIAGASRHMGKDAVDKYHLENGEYALHQARRHLRRVHVDHTVKLAVGDPATVIVRHAVRNRCDLIVVGSHGRSALKSLFLGSVASKILAHSDVPVLVTR